MVTTDTTQPISDFPPAMSSSAQYTNIPERILDAIPGILTWLAILASILGVIYLPIATLWVATAIMVYVASRFILIAFANYLGFRKIKQWETEDWHQRYLDRYETHDLPWDAIKHLVIIPNYQESIDVLRKTLNNLKQQYEADKRLIVVLAMEASEPQSAAKARQLEYEFEGAFAHLIHTSHPKGRPGAIQCKSANESWAVQKFLERHQARLGINIDHICVTTMDADTRFHPRFFYALTYQFATDRERWHSFWQAQIRYHGNIWQINPLFRLVNSYATAIELATLAAPWWMSMPISSYSLSLRLLKESGNWDVDVIADEWHMYLKAYFHAQEGQVAVKPIFLPFLADATVGDNLIASIRERYIQTRRHAWGSKEIGFAITKWLQPRKAPLMYTCRLLMRLSHDILMAGAGWAVLTVGSQLTLLFHPELAPVQPHEILGNPEWSSALIRGLLNRPQWAMLTGCAFIMVMMSIVLWYQDVPIRPKRRDKPTVQERVLTFLSFPLMPVLTMMVMAIPNIHAQTMLMVGQPLEFQVTPKATNPAYN